MKPGRRPGRPGPPPGHGERLKLAETLIVRNDLAQAQRLLEQVLAKAPGDPRALHLLSAATARAGNWPALRKALEARLRQDPPGVQRDYNEAHLRLLFGDLPRGWDLYEARIPYLGMGKMHRSTRPRWNGEPFPGRTLLMEWEQGFGDTVMFVRYAALAKARGGTVMVGAQRELADLVATCPGVDRVITHLEPLPEHDLQVPLPSLPGVFRTDLDSIPADIPYLDIPARVPHRQELAQALAASRGRTRIGVAWAGSPTHKRDAERSLPPAVFAPLGVLPDVAWHSFQLGRADAPPLPGLVGLAPLLQDFSDTAYALSGMDLVITADTALAHLAGALGIPTLVLVAFGPDFRWLLHRSDSPWYPSVRLYRQPVPGDWDAVIAAVRRDLSGPNP
ncbi:MAG: glycosyltransferase family 9 protein [Holophaga sp.]|jgi:hypothetical protein